MPSEFTAVDAST